MPAWSRSSSGGVLLAALVFVAVFGPWLVDTDPSSITGEALRAPTAQHPFGTDDLGRDLLAGVLYGTRTSLVVGFVAAAFISSLSVSSEALAKS